MSEILLPEQSKYLNKFIQSEDALIKEMEAYAKENKVPILAKDSSKLLELLILTKKPKRVLELGTAIAYSSIRVARCLSSKGILHTIEKSKDNIKLAKKYIKKSGMGGKIKLLSGNALDIMPKLDKKYDFIFLDADKQDYMALFKYSFILLKKNGIIFIDNLLWHGYAAASEVPESHKESTKIIREFNEMFITHSKLKSSILSVGDGIGIGIKMNN